MFRILQREIRPAGSLLRGFKSSFVDRIAFRGCRGVFCSSEAIRRELLDALSNGCAFPGGNAVSSGCTFRRGCRRSTRPCRIDLGLPLDAPVVGQFSRIHPVKGIDTFLRAAALIHTAFPDARFLVVGDSDDSREGSAYKNQLKELSHELKIADRVIWTGFSTKPQLLMAACDATALATRAEGLGLVVLESWLAGRPVAASDIDGPGETVGLSGGGLLHPVDDYRTMAVNLLHLLRNPAERQERARRGREWVLKTCSAEIFQQRFLAELGHFLANGKGKKNA